MKKCSSYILLPIAWLCLLCLVWSCSGEPQSPVPGDGSDGAAVSFSAGQSVAQSRTAFAAGHPVKVFVYLRDASATGSNFSVAPYKTVEGVTSDSGTGGLSDVVLTGGDIDADGVLRLPGGDTYDFVVVVNASGGGLGSLSAGLLSGFGHGSDILSGKREGVVIPTGQRQLNVTFTGYGADADGNLPHLCSAVRVESRATRALIDYLDGGLDYAVSGIDFKQCLPQSANLSLASNPMALNVLGSGYRTTYSADIPGETVAVTTDADMAESTDAIVLPCPLHVADRDYNVMNIDFYLRVNGGDVLFQAPGVHVPEFKPGYRYRFIVELDHDAGMQQGKVNLLLSIEPWSAVSWQSGMGEDDTENRLVLQLGSWSSISWQSGMGDPGSGNASIISVSSWRTATWASQMGKDE